MAKTGIGGIKPQRRAPVMPKKFMTILDRSVPIQKNDGKTAKN